MIAERTRREVKGEQMNIENRTWVVLGIAALGLGLATGSAVATQIGAGRGLILGCLAVCGVMILLGFLVAY